MKNPFIKKTIFKLKLEGKKDFGQDFSCLGEQFIKILKCIADETVGYKWFVSDLEYAGYKSKDVLFPMNDGLVIPCIANTDNLIQIAKQIHQFNSGVFVAVKKSIMVNWDTNWLPETEEDEGLQHPDAEIEIRAFDFSYFEIYCTDIVIAKKLKKCFDKMEIEDL